MMNMMSKMMLSCESAGVLICKKQHEPLKFREKISLRVHLFSCKLCKRFELDIKHVQAGIDHYKECTTDNCFDHHLDESQKKSIRLELENQMKR
jgi:hypothetical protein